MRILMISDIHYSRKPFHGQDQSKAFEWLYGVVEKEEPDLLLSAGDFGEEASLELFNPILENTHFLTIYGNHDNVKLIKTLRNRSGSPCLLPDGFVRSYDGMKIAGINGNVARIKKKVHHKTGEEISEIISKYAHRGRIDVLITHEAPKHELISRGKMLGNDVFNEAIERLRPRLYLCGHVHVTSQVVELNNTCLVSLDSGTRHQEYVMAEYGAGQIHGIEIISPER